MLHARHGRRGAFEQVVDKLERPSRAAFALDLGTVALSQIEQSAAARQRILGLRQDRR